MGTRSRIGIEDGETGKVRSIYCHWDGYPEGVGRTLLEHYSSREKVEELIALGSISSLGAEIGEPHRFSEYEKSKLPPAPEGADWTLAYGRDRGETGVEAVESDNDEAMYALAQDGWEEYCYLYRQGVWSVTEVGGAAGPFLVNANDPNGEAESRWQRIEAVLNLGDQALELGRTYAIG